MAKVGNASYNKRDDFPDNVPIFPLAGVLLLPGGQLPLNIFEPRYLEMIMTAQRSNQLVGMIQPDIMKEEASNGEKELYEVGCLGRITSSQETGDGRLLINLTGACRFRITQELENETPYRVVNFDIFEQDLLKSNEGEEVDREALLVAFRNFIEANGMEADWEGIEQAGNEVLVNALCMLSPFEPPEKQALLEAESLQLRSETLIAISEMYLAKMTSGTEPSLQ